MEWQHNDFVIDDDGTRTDPIAVYELLKDTYWARGRELAMVKKTIANSHCFNVWKDGRQVGFARVVTDYLVQHICEHPDIPGHKLVLRTKDAHGLYEKYGFERSEFMCR